MKAERCTRDRDGQFLGEKGEKIVISPGGGGKLGRGVGVAMRQSTQEVIDVT